ncbi:carbohydrate ABC transporter permease [Dietzia maris]|uniref:carbohydrate ABC transporter permease n=1 Tax=Dietzia maris TaxID=37915 RepID=UPI0037C77A41
MTATLPAPAAPEDTDTTRSRRDELWRRWAPVLFVTPMAALAFLFMFFPAILTFIGSWFHIPLAGGQWTFVGPANYERLFTDPHSQKAISNTVIYSVGTIIPSLVLGLLLAMIANSLTRGRALVRTLLFLPMTANLVAMAVVFTYIFDIRGGAANQLLALVGAGPVNWLGSTDYSLLTVMIVGIWRTASFTMMIFFAGLATVPGTMLEAARMEGIGGLTRLTRIILPVMTPSVVFAVVMAILQSVQAFDTVRVMTDGGPQYSSELILTHAWRLGFQYFDLGAASAMSFLMVVALAAIGLWQRRILAGKKDNR